MHTTHARILALALSLTLVAAACGGSDSETAEESSTTTPATAETTTQPPPTEDQGAEDPEPMTSGLTITAVDLTTGMVTITNNGSDGADLTGYQLCNRPTYIPVPAEVLAPGAAIEVALGDMSADGGEAALYSSQSFGSASDMVSYVVWGSEGGRQSVAEEAGLWTGGPIADPGASITLTGDPNSADGWG